MKNARLAMAAAALAAAGLFAGCTTARTDGTASLNDTTMSGSTSTGASASATTADSSVNAAGHGHATVPAAAHSSTTTAGNSSAAMGHSAGDMKAMCDMHDRVMKAKTDAERDAALDASVRAMAPAEKKKYVDMLHKHCM